MMTPTRRTLPRQRLERSPLIQVLGQVTFSSRMFAVWNYLPQIHDALRSMGLSETRESTVIEHEIVLSPTGGPQPVAGGTPRKRLDFLQPDRRWGVVLTEDLVVLHTSKYDTFEPFLERLIGAVEAVIAPAKIERLGRIGLRYVDRVRKQDGERFEDYVIPPMLGFPREQEEALGGRRVFSRSDTILQTSAGALAIRAVEGQGLTLPPDLMPSVLFTPDDARPEEPILLLDFDHFRVEEMSADLDQLRDLFWALHDPVDMAFRTVATEHAWQAWGRAKVS